MQLNTKEIAGIFKRCEVPGTVHTSAAITELTRALPKFEQVAFYVPDIAKAKIAYRALGCNVWKDDTVTAKGRVGLRNQAIDGVDTVNVAQLAFNYDLGTELELITYVAGSNWHNDQGRVDLDGQTANGFMSHMSYHVTNMDVEVKRLKSTGLGHVIQDVKTLSHTNPYLIEQKRKYRYVIFSTRAYLGFDVKLIQRLEGL